MLFQWEVSHDSMFILPLMLVVEIYFSLKKIKKSCAKSSERIVLI